MRMEEKEHKNDYPLSSEEVAKKRAVLKKSPEEEESKTSKEKGTLAAPPNKNGKTPHENNKHLNTNVNDEDDFQKTTVGDHGRAGLSSEEADILYEEVGFNELKHVEVSALKLFFLQLTGLMPYVLETAAVISIAILEYVDFGIILAILLANASLGYYEEMKAKKSLAELTNKMEQTITVVRDGKAQQMVTRFLVPGDVILLIGGTSVPADVDWLEGDTLSIDTAALTGESMPRKYPCEEYGKRIYAGTTVAAGEAYCLVRKTGGNTEIGSSQEEIMEDKLQSKRSVFEERVLMVVKVVISVSLLIVLTIFLVQGIARKQFTTTEIIPLLSFCVAVMVASVPVALPLVMQVTMALGAGQMAKYFDAVVTSLPALQDISSMSILCSDKTGTLTTARISIHYDMIWCTEGFSKEDVTLFARLASSPDKEDDPIDRSCIDNFERHASEHSKAELSKYKLTRNTGFNPIYKRVIWEFNHPEGHIIIAKGLPNKVVDTEDGGQDDADDQWKVENAGALLNRVADISEQLSSHGYKTIGVAVKVKGGPFRFVGVIPMLDPPRHDSAKTIELLKGSGVSVKMITGDHQNIAKETAHILGMGTNILKSDQLRQETKETEDRIFEADGFAQVLPKDKRRVVEVLKDHFHAVVGMTGDGVNDAPALSAAQCGIAVNGATDAAKNAAAIILTTPGLSAVYSAVVESRRIFRKLRSYVMYRIAATIQIVLSLSLIVFISNCEIYSIFIVLLALFNDLTMLPIAYDRQQASAHPEVTSISRILILSLVLGVTQTIFTMLWTYVSYRTGFFYSNFDIFACPMSAQNGVWVELTISTELLIFSTRTPKLFFNSIFPSPWLVVSVLLGTVIISVFAATIPAFGTIHPTDILIIWLYVIITMIIVDLVKYATLLAMGETFEELEISSTQEVLKEEEEEEKKIGEGEEEVKEDVEQPPTLPARSREHEEDAEELRRRQLARLKRVDEWVRSPVQIKTETTDALARGTKRSLSDDDIVTHPSLEQSGVIHAGHMHSAPAALRQRYTRRHRAQEMRYTPATDTRSNRIVLPSNYSQLGSITDLSRPSLSSASIRPHTPATGALNLTDRSRATMKKKIDARTRSGSV